MNCQLQFGVHLRYPIPYTPTHKETRTILLTIVSLKTHFKLKPRFHITFQWLFLSHLILDSSYIPYTTPRSPLKDYLATQKKVQLTLRAPMRWTLAKHRLNQLFRGPTTT